MDVILPEEMVGDDPPVGMNDSCGATEREPLVALEV
jgi:hypothetical protein